MKRNKKLKYAWIIFITIVVIFVAGVEFYHYFNRECVPNYQCRILINKDLASLESESKKPRVNVKKETEKDTNWEIKLYEHTKYGDLPKIIPHGKQVFDVYSSHFNNPSSAKKVFVAVLIEGNVSPEEFSNSIKILGEAKITFILPNYLDKLDEITKIISENGHEFFLQIPTQSSIPANQKNAISPFLANANFDDTIEKLRYLIASAKHMIGIANITPTLLTKSQKDMLAIGEELTNRGLAFLDLEKSNEILKQLSLENGLIYDNLGTRFGSDGFDISKVKDGDSIVVPFEQLLAFTNGLAKDLVMAPVSLLMKRFSMLPYRNCVAIFLVKDDKVLVGQRTDIPGAWQLPQGGIEEGESYLEAARRELFEETNAKTVKVLGSTLNKYKYDFPESAQRKFLKNGKQVKYVGQELSFVVFEFCGDESELNVAKDNKEFSSWKWIEVDELLQIIVDFKKTAYEKAVEELKQLKVFL